MNPLYTSIVWPESQAAWALRGRGGAPEVSISTRESRVTSRSTSKTTSCWSPSINRSTGPPAAVGNTTKHNKASLVEQGGVAGGAAP